MCYWSLIQKVALSFDFDEFDDENDDAAAAAADDDDKLSVDKSCHQELAEPVVGMASCIMFCFHTHAI